MGKGAGESRPVISVITPSRDSGSFIGETLDSVQALQSPHEHIVIDGGSTDGTVDVLRSRDDSSLTWTSEPDGGQTHAVNLGLKRARGALIGWLNADDAYLPENVDEAVRLLLADPELDAVYGYMDIVDVSGIKVRQYRCGRFSWTRFLYAGEYIPTPTLIFRRSLLARAPQLDETCADSADYEFYLRLLRGARVERLNRSLVQFRFHPGSKTAGDLETQRREALSVRLRYARNGPDRAIMRGIERAHRVRNSLVSPWPQLPGPR